MVFNVITGLLAAWGISVTWALGIIPFLGLVISSIILTWPRKKPQ
jgi:ABC-type enterochelin transport system permease subunit